MKKILCYLKVIAFILLIPTAGYSLSKPDSLLITTYRSFWFLAPPQIDAFHGTPCTYGKFQFLNEYRPDAFFMPYLQNEKIMKFYRYKGASMCATYTLNFYNFSQNTAQVCKVKITQRKGEISASTESSYCYFRESHLNEPGTEMKLQLILL